MQGHNYYRIKEVYVSGLHEYSNKVYAIFDNRTNGISVFPNPLVNNQCNLEFKNMSAGKYFVNMINQSGQVVYKTTVAHDGTLRNYKLNIPALLSRGVYRLIITNTGSSVSSSTSVIIP